MEPAAGLVCPALPPYLGGMGFFSRMSPIRAFKDFRFFLQQRHPYELAFLMLAMAVTGVFIIVFLHDTRVDPPYKRDIIYVQQWRLDRTDDEIRAQQKIDAPIKQKRLDEEKAFEAAKRAQFKKMDDQMSRWGL